MITSADPGSAMTLAALFLFSTFSVTLSPFLGQIAALQPAAASSTSASETQAQESASSTNATNSQSSSQSSTTQTPSASKSAPSKTPTGKKKPASQDCSASPAPVASGAQASQPANQPSPDASAPSAEAGAASAAKTTPANNCPPAKIIVRQGGAAEPRIQLAGRPTAAEAAHKRDAVNQRLGATNQNLKKTAGWQLSSSQRDTITQTQQFIKQSKEAMKNGDLERALTLAWKAELLSEDLVNPQK